MTDITDVPEAGRSAGGRSRSTTTGRRFLLRVAGLPIEAVDTLRCPLSRRWAEEVVLEEERLRVLGGHLSDLLHPCVSAEGDERTRRRLLQLRRQLFNNRLPADPQAVPHLLDGGPAEEVAAWLKDRERLEELRAQGTALLDDEVRRTRTALRRRLTEDRLRSGLLLASPTLDGQLDSYVHGDPRRLDKRMRKIERSALTYLYRAACKTSPFGTFTGVKLGEFVEGPAAEGLPVRLDEEWSGHPRLNVVVLNRFAELVLADPDRRGDLPVSLASGWGSDRDRIRFVRSRLTPGNDDDAVTHDVLSDRLFFLRRSGVLERVLNLFAERPSLRYRDLVGRLATGENAEPAECEQYVNSLLALGVVHVPALHTDVHSPDPLRAFQDSLLSLECGWARELAALLDRPISCLARYADADAQARRKLLRELRRDLNAFPAAMNRGDATLPQSLIYEDVRAGDGLVRWNAQRWRQVAGDPLDDLQRVLPAFDPRLPAKITFQGFFLARHGRGGRCDDVLSLVHEFHEDLFDQYTRHTVGSKRFDDFGEYLPEENWLDLAGISALDAARREFVKGMRELWDTAGGAEEVHLDPRVLSKVADELEPVAAHFQPQTHLLQWAERADGPLVVINKSYGNLSFPFSRFTHCFDEPAGFPGGSLSDWLRGESSRVRPDGAVFAEITGGAVTTNLNLHGRLSDYQIVCPGESSSVPYDDRIHLDDLYLQHDAEADRVLLRSRRLRREVVPVYFGYLVPAALPKIPRTLLLLSPMSATALDVWAGVAEGAPDAGVTTRPRVRHGSVVLSRRSWTAAAAALPVRSPADTDTGWFLAWQRWRHAHRLPDRVFATISTEARYGPGDGKPQYVDFAGYLSLTALDAMVKSAEGRVVFREMLPAPDELHAWSDRGGHVTELAVETFHQRGAGARCPTAGAGQAGHPHRAERAAGQERQS